MHTSTGRSARACVVRHGKSPLLRLLYLWAGSTLELRADYFHFPPDTSEPEHVAQRPGGTAAAAVPAAAAAMSAAAAGAHAHAGGPGAGAAQAAPVLDMSRHKSGIVPVVQCEPALRDAPRSSLPSVPLPQERCCHRQPGLPGGPDDHRAARTLRGVRLQGAPAEAAQPQAWAPLTCALRTRVRSAVRRSLCAAGGRMSRQSSLRLASWCAPTAAASAQACHIRTAQRGSVCRRCCRGALAAGPCSALRTTRARHAQELPR